MSASQDEIRQIEAAIAALEAQRPVLGDAVVETAIAPLREKLEALKRAQTLTDERKRVTVLFADVSGYTAMSERMDPEDVADIMNRLFERVEAQITRYGGTVDKYSGDAVMALFGAPKALENHEEMAVRAALAIQQEVDAYSAELRRDRGIELKMRVGINTGSVLAGMIGGLGTRHYTVMGDTVNLAARLEQACPVGRVMVSAATARRLHAIFEFEPPRQITVKGKSEPVTVYVVLGERAERGRVRGLEGFEAPMVGRDRELALLRETLDDALGAQRWRVVAVVGNAGIGKTRLRREFVAWVETAHPEAHVLSARAYAHTRSTPYSLVTELVRALFGLTGEEGERETLAALQGRLALLDPAADIAEQRYRLGSLAALLGIQMADNPLNHMVPEQRRDRIFLSLERLFLCASSQVPLVIVIDDLHWADLLSAAFLRHLLEAVGSGETAGRRALVLILSRPADVEVEAEHPVRAVLEALARPPHRTLHLAPLPPDQSETLVATLLRERVPAEVVRLVVEHAQGNPFFVEEILRTLIEEGTLQHVGEAWVLTRAIEDVDVPASVQDLLSARIDKLPPLEKRALQHAAIIGRTFWQGVLQVTLREEHVPEEQVPRILDDLEHRQLTVHHGHAPIGDDWEWAFRHVLIQEVAYRGVRKRVRRRVHRLVAQQLERRLNERTGFLIPLIAYHYERGDLPDKAVEYLRRAGEQAAAQFANEDAVRYLTRALFLLDNTTWPDEEKQATRYTLLMAREELYHLIGRRDDQEQDLRELEALAAALGDARRLAEVALRRAAYAEAVSDYPAALRAVQAAVRQAEVAGAPTLQIEALVTWGRVLWQQGEMEEARRLLEEALVRSRRHRYWQGEAASLHYLGTVFYLLGDLEQARVHLEEALAIRRHMDDQRGMAMSLNNLIAVYYGLGDYARAREYGEETLHLLQMVGDRLGEAKALNNLGAIYHVFGDLDRALELHRQGLSVFRRVGSRYGEALSLGNLAVIFYDRGEYEHAREYAARALAEQRALESKSGEADEKTHLALAEEALGALDEAARLYDEARQLREEMGQTALAMEDVAGLARIAWRRGQVEEALHLARRVAAWIEAHGVEGAEYPFRLYLTAIDIFAGTGHHGEARRLAEEAVARLRAQAQRISDPDVRRAFLEGVPLHRAIRERATLLAGGGEHTS